VNFPGGVPIDGPSAGVTMVIAIYSAISGKAVDNTVAMTGEVTIHGQVQGVGGIVAKVNAAREAGAKRVLIPKDNWQELFTGLSGIEVIPIRHVSEALRHAVVGSREPLSHISRGVPEGGLLSASNASLTP
jgi:Lon-like ATP-dependent protease